MRAVLAGGCTYAETNYANPHALTGYFNGTATTTYAYDTNGNLLTLTGAATSTYTWDYRNRMISAWVSGATSTYAYDHTIARMAQRTSTTTSHYPNKFYSIDYAANSTTTATSTSYIWHGDTLVAYIEQRIASGQATGTPTTYYSHPDHLGSTNVVTNASGTVAETLDYYPYGAERIHSGTANLDRTFVGQFGDDPSALSYLNARYYDAARGQFTSQDPVFWEVGQTADGRGALSNPQAMNSYLYAGGNPIANKDPSGRFWWKEFYTDWNGYSGWQGLGMKAGEVFGGRFAAQDAIAANSANIAASAAQTGVSPSMYQAIMYEENAHQLPPFGGERMIENACPSCVSGGIGVMQVSARTSGKSNSALLDDKTNVNAAGFIIKGIQSKYGSNPSTVGAYYNSGAYGAANAHAASYGQRVNSYTSSSFNPTMGDRAVRAGANVSASLLSSISSTISAISKSLKAIYGK